MKRFLSGFLSLLLTASALSLPVRADDSNELIFLTFDGSSTEGFGTYTNGGSCDISNENEALCVTISSVGSLDYADQVYYDGFALTEGCEYTYSFDISSDYDRQIQYRLQLNGGDYHAYVEGNLPVTGEVLHFSTDWTMGEASDPAPRLVFNLGRMPDMEEEVPEHQVRIDNISLVVKDDSRAVQAEALPEYELSAISQIGYAPADEKQAFLRDETGSDLYTTFRVIRDEDGSEAYAGALSEAAYDKATWSHVRVGDFSSLAEEGSYHVEFGEGDDCISSASFRIGTDVYEEVFRDLFLMLYRQRCGEETDPAIAGRFAHGACHTGLARVYGEERTFDVSGGWHDAGDYGRYVVSGAKTVLDLYLAYELFGEEADDLGIPESGNGFPDVLDEARYELDWLLKMQDPENGGVWHKVTAAAFPGEVTPEEETEELLLAPISVTATADFAAVMARASVLWAKQDPAFASEAYEAAQSAFAYLKEHAEDAGFKNPEDIVTGEYPDAISADERILAGVSLALAGDPEAEDLLGLWYEEAANGFRKDVLSPALGWQKMNTYTLIALMAEEAPASDVLSDIQRDLTDRVLTEAGTMAELAETDAYHMTFGKEYPWGSNMSVANAGITFLLAECLTGDSSWHTLAEEQRNYLFGANALSLSYVTGYGTRSPQHPHHRPSQAAGEAMPGMLVGGPDSSLEDPYAKAVLANSAPAMRYADNAQSYSTNEVTVYWNSPLLALLAGLAP